MLQNGVSAVRKWRILKRGDANLVENGSASVGRFAGGFAQFLAGVDHIRGWAEKSAVCKGGVAFLRAAGKETAGHALLIVVLQEVQHAALVLPQALPVGSEFPGAARAFHNPPCNIVEAGFVVQIIETCSQQRLVVGNFVCLADKDETGLYLTHLGDEPGKEFPGHEFHHVAAEPVHPKAGPEKHYALHRLPGSRGGIIHLAGVGPVEVAVRQGGHVGAFGRHVVGNEVGEDLQSCPVGP